MVHEYRMSALVARPSVTLVRRTMLGHALPKLDLSQSCSARWLLLPILFGTMVAVAYKRDDVVLENRGDAAEAWQAGIAHTCGGKFRAA